MALGIAVPSFLYPLNFTWHKNHLNFYRIHLICFILIPLFFSGILYASNGQFHISYIDCLFVCISSMTVTGLATIDLSTLTGFQQAILFFLSSIGTPVVVSWLILCIRMHYFKVKFDHIVQRELARRASVLREARESGDISWTRRLLDILRFGSTSSAEPSPGDSENALSRQQSGGSIRRVRPDMIRRLDHAPQLVNPMGWISEGRFGHAFPRQAAVVESPKPYTEAFPPPIDPENPALPDTEDVHPSEAMTEAMSLGDLEDQEKERRSRPTVRRGSMPSRRRLSDPGARLAVPVSPQRLPPRVQTLTVDQDVDPMPRTQTIEFAPSAGGLHRRKLSVSRERHERDSAEVFSEGQHTRGSGGGYLSESDRRPTRRPSGQSMRRTSTGRSDRQIHQGFGGFPMPHELLIRLFRWIFPKAQQAIHRTLTIPRTSTLASNMQGNAGPLPPGTRAVPYISFPAIVGRNSAFQMLTEQQLDELGGIEYRAVKMLLWIVGLYHIGMQLFGFVIIAPYVSQARWRPAFEAQWRFVPPTWFAAFQVVSAYTNTGTSLMDLSMIPFQTAYVMILVLYFLILAGNTAFPIFLRFVIWIMTKITRRKATNETLHFLLDHPRRCFIYLFPSHQTWFLLTVLVLLNLTDWFFFLILDIGNSAIESIPLGTRFFLGLLQAGAVRAAGFASISLAALAPAVKVLYVTMMYVSVYPIAMSVRATNVYEERSLGVFEEDESDDEDEISLKGKSRTQIWGKYLTWHARKQLSFDMWWLGLVLWLLCIIERDNLMNPDNDAWFNIFQIIFEIVSAYGTVGLSLGIPTANYSFSGSFKPLSKLLICAVMIRGRHRGLPVAIDRAVLLPFEFRRSDDGTGEQKTITEAEAEIDPPSTNVDAVNGQRPEYRHEKLRSNGAILLEPVPEFSAMTPQESRAASEEGHGNTGSRKSSGERREDGGQ